VAAIYTNSLANTARSKQLSAAATEGPMLLSYPHHIENQESVDNQQLLTQELAALQHELRRVNDAIERNRTRDMEKRARLLRDNIALCEAQLNQMATP
jgi:hypothetical protein